MELRDVTRTALDRSLRTVRLPFDVATRVLPGDGDARPTPRSVVRLTLDRADAAVRDVAGRVWRDPALRDDARRRRVAADERARAMRLRAEAETRTETGDADLRRHQEAAEQRRREAEQKAEAKRERADARKQAEERGVVQQAARKKAAVRGAAAKTEAAVDKKARQARLERLDEHADALAAEERALATADEAQRLKKAAGKAKAARKQAS